MSKIKNVVKSSSKAQLNNIVSVTGNSGSYVKMGVTSHTQYNNGVSMSKSKYIFDTENNINIIQGYTRNVDFTRFITIGNEVVICGCILMHDIIDAYTNGCIQQFYECFSESHSASESITLARFLSAIGIEIWKDIECFGGIYSGKYMVSNLSRVLSLNTNKILKQFDNPNGYLYVYLWHHNKKQAVRVHRLVGLTFYGEPTEPLECCHSNTNRCDNRLFNLEFKTHLENVNNPITQRKLKETLKAKFDKADTPTASTSTAPTLE